MKPLELYKRELGSFYHWHDRLVILKRALDESSPTHSLSRLWHDRRNAMQWYTLWVAVILGVLGLCLSTIQLVLSAVQLSRSSPLRDIVVGAGQQPSATNSTSPDLAAATHSAPNLTVVAPSGKTEEPGHQLSSWAIVAITSSAIGAFLLILITLIYVWIRLRRRNLGPAHWHGREGSGVRTAFLPIKKGEALTPDTTDSFLATTYNVTPSNDRYN